MTNSSTQRFHHFSTPLENYRHDLDKIKTFQDVQNFILKHSLILDDAEEPLKSITPTNFQDFISQLPKALSLTSNLPDVEWLTKYSAIVLPKLFMQLTPLVRLAASSGFVMNRLLDEGMAEIKDGKFRFK